MIADTVAAAHRFIDPDEPASSAPTTSSARFGDDGSVGSPSRAAAAAAATATLFGDSSSPAAAAAAASIAPEGARVFGGAFPFRGSNGQVSASAVGARRQVFGRHRRDVAGGVASGRSKGKGHATAGVSRGWNASDGDLSSYDDDDDEDDRVDDQEVADGPLVSSSEDDGDDDDDDDGYYDSKRKRVLRPLNNNVPGRGIGAVAGRSRGSLRGRRSQREAASAVEARGGSGIGGDGGHPDPSGFPRPEPFEMDDNLAAVMGRAAIKRARRTYRHHKDSPAGLPQILDTNHEVLFTYEQIKVGWFLFLVLFFVVFFFRFVFFFLRHGDGQFARV